MSLLTLGILPHIYHYLTNIHAAGPEVQLGARVVNFMQINVGEKATRTIDIVNNSDIDATFQVSVFFKLFVSFIYNSWYTYAGHCANSKLHKCKIIYFKTMPVQILYFNTVLKHNFPVSFYIINFILSTANLCLCFLLEQHPILKMLPLKHAATISFFTVKKQHIIILPFEFIISCEDLLMPAIYYHFIFDIV